ncbi:MAG: two-component system response regulator [Desulfuromonas sp.]|nr:MAG: two-component system response regulator [Desulfuromonas sp.]
MGEKTVLLVEDNQDDISLMKRAFRENHLSNKLVIAHDGEEALEFLFGEKPSTAKKPRHLPEFVILDLRLPKISGIEVLKKIRSEEKTCSLPVIVLTSSEVERDLNESYLLGANSYIQKPVQPENFIAAVRQLGFYWLMFNELPKQNREQSM